MPELIDAHLAADLARPLSAAFPVLVLYLDTGRVVLGPRALTLGHDRILAALTAIDAGTEGASATLIADALDDVARAAWWSNRRAVVYDCTPDMGSVVDGAVRFSGVCRGEPEQVGGLWSINLIPPRRRVRPVPDLGIITTTDWPTAAPDAVGRSKPEIWGTVDGCPLLPVALPAATTLSADALPDDGQLEVDDAAALPASGTVWVDGHAYAYSARSDVALLGVDVAAAHRQGTAVVLDGDSVFLAAGHAVTAIDTVRSDGRPVAGAALDLAAATVTFAEPPTVMASAERFTLTEHFDSIGSGSTALNGTNAIRAVTASPSQSATALPSGVTAATANAVITFARPAGGRIVAGAYTVAFSVTVGTQVGWARLRIGREIVWFYEPPGPALYAFNPASFIFDDDADAIPVVVEVAEGGSTDQVSVTISSASRVVGVGNLDDANFATLRTPSNLLWRAEQSTPPVDRGRIVKASLWVRWFASGSATPPTTTVSFDGRTLGTLAQTALSNATLSQTVSVNSVTQGTAALPSQNLSALISGGTASLSHTTITQRSVITAALEYPRVVGGFIIRRGWTSVPVLTGWSAGLGNITAKLLVRSSGAPTNILLWADLKRSNGTTIAQIVVGIGTWTSVATDMWESPATSISEAPTAIFWNESDSGNGTSLLSMSLEYNAQPTSVAQTFSSTPVSASAISAQNLSNSGIAVALANNAISFTVPAPPRVQDSIFPLAWVRDWADLDGLAEISAASGGADVCLNQVALLVEFDAEVHARVETLTATVTGRDGNPAAVLQTLATATGQTLDIAAYRRLSDWCAANGLAFARRVADPTDALTLLTYAAEQCNVMLADLGDRLRPVRYADLYGAVTILSETDLLEPARITWAERIETDITLRYAEDYAGDAGFTRVVQATAANNTACRDGEVAIAESRRVDIDGGWLRADTAAAQILADLANRVARPRRVLSLSCPYSVTAQAGDLIEYLPLGGWAGGGIVARVTRRTESNGWPEIEAEEIVGVR